MPELAYLVSVAALADFHFLRPWALLLLPALASPLPEGHPWALP